MFWIHYKTEKLPIQYLFSSIQKKKNVGFWLYYYCTERIGLSIASFFTLIFHNLRSRTHTHTHTRLYLIFWKSKYILGLYMHSIIQNFSLALSQNNDSNNHYVMIIVKITAFYCYHYSIFYSNTILNVW